MNDLDRLLVLESSLHYRDREKNKEYESLKAKIQVKLDGVDKVLESWKFSLKQNKDLESNVRSNDILCDVYVKEINSLESQIKGEKLLSEKRRTDGIEMMLEIAKLKEEAQIYIREVGILRAERNESLRLLDKYEENKIIVKSGEPVTITGYYKLVNHNPECFRTTMSNGMFFKKREEAPMTGACEHVAEWELISEYEGSK